MATKQSPAAKPADAKPAAAKASAAKVPPGRRLDHPPKPHAYLRALLLATGLTILALLVGMLGYHFLNGEPWIDALVDAAMILGGMGPVGTLTNDRAKVFASIYALFSGLFLIGTAAVMLSPWIHRLLHHLHADEKDDRKER